MQQARSKLEFYAIIFFDGWLCFVQYALCCNASNHKVNSVGKNQIFFNSDFSWFSSFDYKCCDADEKFKEFQFRGCSVAAVGNLTVSHRQWHAQEIELKPTGKMCKQIS